MNKYQAITNCLAVLNYALWKYEDSIVSMTHNGISFQVDIQLERSDYNSERELEKLRNVITAGADIRHLKPLPATFNILVIRYRYEQ